MYLDDTDIKIVLDALVRDYWAQKGSWQLNDVEADRKNAILREFELKLVIEFCREYLLRLDDIMTCSNGIDTVKEARKEYDRYEELQDNFKKELEAVTKNGERTDVPTD